MYTLHRLSLKLRYLHVFAFSNSSYWHSLTVFYSNVMIRSSIYTFYAIPKLMLLTSASFKCSNFRITSIFLVIYYVLSATIFSRRWHLLKSVCAILEKAISTYLIAGINYASKLSIEDPLKFRYLQCVSARVFTFL